MKKKKQIYQNLWDKKNLWDAAKAVLSKKFLATITLKKKKKERPQNKSTILQLKKLEKNTQITQSHQKEGNVKNYSRDK